MHFWLLEVDSLGIVASKFESCSFGHGHMIEKQISQKMNNKCGNLEHELL